MYLNPLASLSNFQDEFPLKTMFQETLEIPGTLLMDVVSSPTHAAFKKQDRYLNL